MKAINFSAFGGPKVLHLEELPEPELREKTSSLGTMLLALIVPI